MYELDAPLVTARSPDQQLQSVFGHSTVHVVPSSACTQHLHDISCIHSVVTQHLHAPHNLIKQVMCPWTAAYDPSELSSGENSPPRHGLMIRLPFPTSQRHTDYITLPINVKLHLLCVVGSVTESERVFVIEISCSVV